MANSDMTLDILSFLASRPEGGTFGEMKQLGYTAPTLSRLLKSLSSINIVTKGQDGAYFLGESARVLARAILGESSWEEKIRSLLAHLSGQTGESAAYYEKSAKGIRLIAKEEMAESFHYISEGSENFQEKHAFYRVLVDDFPPGQVVHENWETALGFDRLAMAVRSPACDGSNNPIGSMGITFVRGRYDNSKIQEYSIILENLVNSLSL